LRAGLFLWKAVQKASPGHADKLPKDLFTLLLLASLIAFPLAWWGMDRWLQDFAYRIPINGWVFLAAGAGVTSIALFTIGIQAIKAAVANPLDSLRTG